MRAVILSGPTAGGKTGLAHSFPHIFKEFINCDSRQIYRELNIGTAKPSENDLAAFSYHLINIINPQDEFSAFNFIREAERTLLEKNKSNCLLIGGTTFYIDALLHGLPQHAVIEPRVREGLKEDFTSKGLPFLLEELKEKDPAYYEIVDKNNHRRVMRALEIIRGLGISFSELRKDRKKSEGIFLPLAVYIPRAKLYKNAATRLDQMIEAGLEKEVITCAKDLAVTENISLSEVFHLPGLKSIGYREFLGHKELKEDPIGFKPLEEIKSDIIKNTRHFIKRQCTWLKSSPVKLYLIPEEYKNAGLWAKEDDFFTSLEELSNSDWGELIKTEEPKKLYLDEKGRILLEEVLQGFYAV